MDAGSVSEIHLCTTPYRLNILLPDHNFELQPQYPRRAIYYCFEPIFSSVVENSCVAWIEE